MNGLPLELLVIPAPHVAVISASAAVAEAVAAALRGAHLSEQHGWMHYPPTLPLRVHGNAPPLLVVSKSSRGAPTRSPSPSPPLSDAPTVRYGNTPAAAPRLSFDPFPWTFAFARRQRAHTAEYDTYAVNGIIRSTWLEKHHTRIPSMILVAFEFDVRASPLDWAAAEALMCGSLAQLRAEFARDRQVDVHVLLVQDRPGLGGGGGSGSPWSGGPQPGRSAGGGPPGSAGGSGFGEDRAALEIAAERVGSFRRKALLDGNSLTMLYSSDCTPNTAVIASLEGVLRERAYGYYTTHIRRWKRGVLPRLVAVPMHLPLRVRVLFKIAHFQEFRLRPHKALKYYALAYTTLLTIPRWVRKEGYYHCCDRLQFG